MTQKRSFISVSLLMLGLLMTGLLLAACGDESIIAVSSTTRGIDIAAATTAPNTTSAPDTTAAPTGTTSAPKTTTAAPNPTTAPKTTAPVATTASNGQNTPAGTGLGAQLIGQLLAIKYSSDVEFDARVTGVQAFDEIKDKDKTYSPVGVFLAVSYDIANVSSNTGSASQLLFQIIDGKGRSFESARNYEASYALTKQDKTKYPDTNAQVQPSQIASAFVLFDLPKDVTDFKLDAGKYYKSSRTPSPDSFKAPDPNAPSSDAGQELVGQLVAIDSSEQKLDIKVKTVERNKEYKKGSKTVTANGVFIVVLADAASVGKDVASTYAAFNLQDDKNRTFKPTSGDILSLLRDIDDEKYDGESAVSPGFVRQILVVFDLPADAKGLKPVAESYRNSSRQPSQDSFKNSGGAGPDSGAGQELVGKTLTINKSGTNFDIAVTKVNRGNTLTDGGKASIKTDGVFVTVIFDATNKGGKKEYTPRFYIKDDKGRSYTSFIVFGSLDIDNEVADNSDQIEPNAKAVKYALFEIPKDAANLTLEAR